MTKIKNFKAHKNLFLGTLTALVFALSFFSKSAEAQGQNAVENRVTNVSDTELEMRNLSYLVQQTKTSKKALDEGKSSMVMKQNYKATIDKFVERMLLLSLKLKTQNQAKNFNQIKDFFSGFEPKLAAQIPTASVNKESGRRMASER